MFSHLIEKKTNPKTQSLKIIYFTVNRTQIFVVTKITDLKVPERQNVKQTSPKLM